MWNNIVERGRPQMIIWHMRIACRIPKATNTHLQYVILIDLPQQQWLHDRASVLSHSILPVLLTLFSCSTFVCRPTDRLTATLECNQTTCNWPSIGLHWTPHLGAANPQLLTTHHCQCVPLLLHTRDVLGSNLGLISADLLGFFVSFWVSSGHDNSRLFAGVSPRRLGFNPRPALAKLLGG